MAVVDRCDGLMREKSDLLPFVYPNYELFLATRISDAVSVTFTSGL
jgi:hypothetical protein